MGTPAYRYLFQPISIGGMELPNRIVMPALTVRYDMNRYRNFYADRARGGAGLLCCNLITLDKEGPSSETAAIEHDGRIPALCVMTDMIHLTGSKVAVQLAARPNWVKSDGSIETVGPSGVNLTPGIAPDPRPLAVSEIHYIVEGIGEAARRAQEAGFDAVELHANSGSSLLSQFMSPVTNRRVDAYGGKLEGRLRLVLEVIQNIRHNTNAHFPIIIRISGSDFMRGGHELKEAKEVAIILEKSGIDAINVSTGWYQFSKVPFMQMGIAEGAWVYLAQGVKEVVNVPVIGGTKIRDPSLADKLLADGKIDLVFIARALIADPEFSKKAKKGDTENIRPCISCCHCLDTILEGASLECTVNAQAGKEQQYDIKLTSQSKNVLVIGGGPGGMEAARVAAMRGHKVALWEEKDTIGGQMVFASQPPYKQEIIPLIHYFEKQLRKEGVKVRLRKKAASAAVARVKADVVIIATGASHVTPDIPGVQGENVCTGVDVLRGREVGEKVIVIGGGMIGCEIAEFLAERGKKVTILEMLPRIGADIGLTHRWVILDRLRRVGVTMKVIAKAMRITPAGVEVCRDGAEEFFHADTVVVAVGMKSNRDLTQELRMKGIVFHDIGDCTQPQRIIQAIEDGLKVGREI